MRQGDIYMVDLEPTEGREQRGRRPVFIVSPDAINKVFAPIVCPVTGGGVSARDAGFTVSLHGLGLRTDGAVLCHQIRTLDIKARGGKRIERAPDTTIEDVLSAIRDIFGAA